MVPMREHPYSFAGQIPVSNVDPTGRAYNAVGQAYRTCPSVNDCPSRSPRSTDPFRGSIITGQNALGIWAIEAKGYDHYAGSNGLRFCSEGSSSYHPGAAECFRQIVASGSSDPSGAQCCYDQAGILIATGPGAGTFDFYAPAVGAKSDGSCKNSLTRSLNHYLWDVWPYNNGEF